MSETSLPIVVKCKRCGEFITIEKVRTAQPDPEGHLLFELTKSISDNAYCPRCKAQIERENNGDK